MNAPTPVITDDDVKRAAWLLALFVGGAVTSTVLVARGQHPALFVMTFVCLVAAFGKWRLIRDAGRQRS